MKAYAYREQDYAFGQAILTLRAAIGLTQTGLADYLGVSRRAVGAWESGSKYPKATHLKAFIELAIQHKAFPAGREANEIRLLWKSSRQKVLLDEIWLAGLLGQASTVPVRVARSIPQPQHERRAVANLPIQPTPFVGREAELAELSNILSDPTCRLLTLLGSGGAGKTRLALEVVAREMPSFNDGVVFVPLASVGTLSQMISAIADSLHLSFARPVDPTGHLIDYLRERHLLLLLDNFEHLLDGADLVYDILQGAPQVLIVVTSRVRLNLQAEWLFDVQGLSYPPNGSSSLADIDAYSAIDLFVQRAKQVQTTFQPTPEAVGSIVRICQHVGGMPLAIELAAAAVRTQSIDEIEEQIHSNLDALSTTLRDVPARHRSMRAVFDHSWDLLSAAEQALFTRLSVFRGGGSAQAAEQIAGATLPALMTLVDKSLLRQINIQMRSTGMIELRFFLLEPLREYAMEKLALRGEGETLQRAHAAYYLQVAEAAAEQWDSPMVEAAVELLMLEHDNMRAILKLLRDSGDSTAGLGLAEALWRFWRSYGYISEGRIWLEQLLMLEETNADPVAMAVRRRALYAAAWLASDQHDYARATELFEEGMILRQALGETEGETDLLLNAARQARAEGQYQRAAGLLEDALARHRDTSDASDDLELSLSEFGQVLRELGLVSREMGHYTRAAALFEEGLQLHTAMGDRAGVAFALLGLADVARDQGDGAGVRQYAEESLAIVRELGIQWAIGFTLNTLAQCYAIEGDLGHALDLSNESVALFRDLQAAGSLAEVLITLGQILSKQGEIAAAQDVLKEAIRLAWAVGPRLMLLNASETLAAVMVQAQQEVLAAQLLGAGAALRDQMTTPPRPADQPALETAATNARAVLGDDDFETLWLAAGQGALEQILSLIPGVIAPEVSIPSDMPPAISLIPESVSPLPSRRLEWNDAVTVPVFYGREWERNLLMEWVVEEHCRVVSILGLGGIGKSSLAVTFMHQVAEHFEVVIWRSLRDIPSCDALLSDLLQTLEPRALGDMPATSEQRISLLLEHMRRTRILLVFDNLESVLEEGENSGQMQAGYESFERCLRQSAETDHQSCLLLTSREKPNVLVPLEGNHAPVRALRLARLDADSSEKLLAEKGVTGIGTDYTRLIESYAGNPLALKIVAQTIVDLFDGSIAPFLEQGEIIFGGVRDLLRDQFIRLSALERSVLLWLAIIRESTTLDELVAVLVVSVPRGRLLEAVEALRRRSLIERGQKPGSLILQSVVLEYITTRLIVEASDEIRQGKLTRLIEHGFALAQGREYIRQIQERLLIIPILEHLRSAYHQKSVLETHLLTLLANLAVMDDDAQGYGAANLISLLRLQRGHLRGLDLAHLVLRGVYLQGVEMQDTTLSDAYVQGTVFTETFDSVTAVATSPAGDYWATGSRRGEVRLWTAGGLILNRAWIAHDDIICAIKFSPDGRTLVTNGSWDGAVKLWDVASGSLLWAARHPTQSYYVTFSPDGKAIATSGYDAVVRVWDRRSGIQLQELIHTDPVCGVMWSPDGRLLATGDLTGHTRLWEMKEGEAAVCIRTLEGHTNCVEGLAFAPDSSTLASGSWDGTVKLWDVASANLLYTLTENKDRLLCLAWSPDGRILATAGRDPTIWLWDVEQKTYLTTLQGHTAGVYGIAFTPDSRNLLSGSEDSTLRVWDITTSRCIHFLHGYAASLYDVDWSPDGTHLVSGGSDALVTIFPANGEPAAKTLAGHQGFVIGSAWSGNGRWLASSEWNNTVRIWDAVSGDSLTILNYPYNAGDYFDRLAWSPDGQRLAIGTYTHGIQFFEMTSQRQYWLGGQHKTWIRHLAWHPDGIRLAAGGADGTVYIWDTRDETLLQRLTGHHSSVIDLAWSPDGKHLVSSSKGVQGGEVFVWDVERGQRLFDLPGHPAIVYAVSWSSNENVIISSDGAGTLRWWDIHSKTCTRVILAHDGTIHSLRRSPDGTRLATCGNDGAIMLWNIHTGEHLKTLRRDRPYERLNISAIRGLTEAQKATLRMLGALES